MTEPTRTPRDEGAAADPAGGAPFLRLLAHELRNYIAPVHNAVHLLRLKARGDATVAPVIDIVERQLVAMNRTLDAVSEMERVRRGGTMVEPASMAVRELIDAAVQSLPATARRDRIVVDVPAALSVEVDAARMTRVIASLLDNALRYAPGETPVEVAVRAVDGALEITIDDAGPGMNDTERRQALDFFRLPHRPGHGLGLGLPLAAATAHLHGGSLRLEPNERGGLRVALRLPSGHDQGAATGRAAQPDTREAPTSTDGSRRVLVADDSAAVRASLTDLLREMGHEVRAVADGAEAVSVAQAWQPEFVLLDIHMPKLNGFDAARKLRALFPSSAMQLVMMSGEGLDDVVRQGARQAGFDHCVDKGLAIGDLGGLLARPPAGDAPRNSL